MKDAGTILGGLFRDHRNGHHDGCLRVINGRESVPCDCGFEALQTDGREWMERALVVIIAAKKGAAHGRED